MWSSCPHVSRPDCIPVLFLPVSTHAILWLYGTDARHSPAILGMPPPLDSCAYKLNFCDRPPRGRFSHLAMFRIGSLLYIPAYISVILYRVFASASDDGNFILMAGEYLLLQLMLKHSC